MDLSDQPFVKNYDAAAFNDAGTYNGKIYEINLGRVSYSGIYYNKDLFAANNVQVPTTWTEQAAACDTFTAANIPCMTAGGKDGWPIFVGPYGSNWPTLAAAVLIMTLPMLAIFLLLQRSIISGLTQGAVKG